MKLKTVLFACLFTILASCNAQSSSPTSNTATTGETVTALDSSIFIIFQASNNTYWFGSDGNGVYRYDSKGITHYSTKHGLNNNRVREIQEDRAGNIFFTTLDGISKFDGQKFIALVPIKSSEPDKGWKLQAGDMWFKAEQGKKGPYRYDGNNLYLLEFPKNNMEEAYYKTFPGNAWSPYDVYHIYKDRRGHLWFGTGAFGIYRYDGNTISTMYEKHLTETAGGGSFGIRSILEDKNGKFWFCNNQYRYSIQSGDTVIQRQSDIKYSREKGFELKAPDGDWIYYLSIIEHKGDLWMATYGNGVYRYDGTSTTHYPVKDDAKNINTYSIYTDNNGTLWLGTHRSGVYKFNGRTFEKFRP